MNASARNLMKMVEGDTVEVPGPVAVLGEPLILKVTKKADGAGNGLAGWTFEVRYFGAKMADMRARIEEGKIRWQTA